MKECQINFKLDFPFGNGAGGINKRDPMSVTCNLLAAIELNQSFLGQPSTGSIGELAQMIYEANRKFSLAVDPGLDASVQSHVGRGRIGRRRGTGGTQGMKSRL